MSLSGNGALECCRASSCDALRVIAFSQNPGYLAGAVFVKVTVNRGLDVPDPCCTAHRPATDLRHRLLPVSSLRPAAVKTSRTNRYRERCSCQSVKRSQEHTSDLQSLMRNSYAVFSLKKKNNTIHSS